MNNEEKILELLEKLDARIGTIETGQAALEGHLDRIKKEQSLINLKLENSSYIQTALEGRMARFEAALEGMQGSADRINARLDYDVCKRLDALSEGQAAIEKRLDILDEMKELAEGTRDRVDVIHAAVTHHSAAITELKKVK